MEKLGNETGGKWNGWKVKRVESETNTFKFKIKILNVFGSEFPK